MCYYSEHPALSVVNCRRFVFANLAWVPVTGHLRYLRRGSHLGVVIPGLPRSRQRVGLLGQNQAKICTNSGVPAAYHGVCFVVTHTVLVRV